MHILILGSGGREHSIAWAVKQNPKCTKLTCAPGNAGMQQIGSCINLDINDGNKIKTWSEKNVSPKKFWSEKKFWLEKILVTKKFGLKNKFGLKKILF